MDFKRRLLRFVNRTRGTMLPVAAAALVDDAVGGVVSGTGCICNAAGSDANGTANVFDSAT